MFTMNSTLQDIKSKPRVMKYLPSLFSSFELSFVKKDQESLTLKDLKEKIIMPWGAPFWSEGLLDSANFALELSEGTKWKMIPLWNENENYVPSADGSKNDTCIFTLEQTNEKVRPAAVICPGGGYVSVAMMNEGIQIAQAMEKAGYKAFVLKYRVSPNHYPEPQKDFALAMKYVRANAAEYKIDSSNIIAIGSSAGGHLCAFTTAANKEIEELLQKEIGNRYKEISSRPDKICLVYPLVSFSDKNMDEGLKVLLGDDLSAAKKVSVENIVDSDFPKTFIWACKDDKLLSTESHAELLYKVLQEKGVESKLHIYPSGGHGCGLAHGTSAEGWFEEMLNFMEEK